MMRALVPLSVCLALGAYAPAALGASTFRPRVGNALGLIPPVNRQGSFNTVPTEGGVFNAVTYHGGPTMTGGVNVHVIFWQAPGFAFQGGPTGAPTYEGLIEQYFADVHHDSTGTAAGPGCGTSACNDFTVEPQYGNGTTLGGITSGQNAISFTKPVTPDSFPGMLTGADVIVDASPYPASCSSPQDTKACIMDSDVQTEIDNIIQAEPTQQRGLNNLWYVFLPPDVDECITQDVCGTNAFGGYHSVSNVGHGTTIYAVTIDPIIEVGSSPQGADPQGNPDAEVAVDTANHEVNEAMTDPTGVGWIDPNAFEVGDKCEFGPQHGTPLGFAANGSPYNQVINGDKYLTQEIWSQADGGCVQASQKTIANSPLPLPQVNLNQFSSTVSGNTEKTTAGIGVQVSVVRTDINGNAITISSSSTTSAADGTWSVTLPGNHAVGDDRDEIDVDYTDAAGHPGSAPTPNHQVILTGNGGNPFTQSGWTGWTDVDNGFALNNGGPSITIGPCFQTGVESVGGPVGTVAGESPTDFCSTSAGTATAPLTGQVAANQAETVSTLDNRAFEPPDAVTPNGNGGLVTLTVPVGEPDSVSLFNNPLGMVFTATGFPTCVADLGAQAVSCAGLVRGHAYTITDGSQTIPATADPNGTVTVGLAVHRGDTVVLQNNAPRTLTTLHVANLQVSINDARPAAVASGTCSADQWTGGPLSSAPVNAAAGETGVALSGAACPDSGTAAGMSTSSLAQTDERSGGSTMITLPDVADTFPMTGETVYGGFTALADSTGAALPVSVSIGPASGGSPVFTSGNVDTAAGVNVPAGTIAPGIYRATWTVTDANGDTRTLTTRFVEEPALQGPPGQQGQPGPQGPQGPPGPKPSVKCHLEKHHKIKCTVTFHEANKGIVHLAVARGGKLVALGHARVTHGRATLTMRELRARTRGRWQVTVVYSRVVQASSSTVTIPLS